jgi:hypothetical protein
MHFVIAESVEYSWADGILRGTLASVQQGVMQRKLVVNGIGRILMREGDKKENQE